MTTNQGDWPEDSSHENGNYNCICYKCKRVFTGHKRRVVCKLCATPIEELQQLAAKWSPEGVQRQINEEFIKQLHSRVGRIPKRKRLPMKLKNGKLW